MSYGRGASATPPRHARRTGTGTAGAVFKALGIGLAVALVSVGSLSAIAVANISRQVSSNAVDISGGSGTVPTIGAMEGGYNLLMVGTDNDASQGDAFGVRDATLNDVNIMLHVSADHKSAVVVSFPRDLLVNIPACKNTDTGSSTGASSETPLNESYERGGLACVVNTIEGLTGLDIPFAATISFNGVVAMTDAIGGVPVCTVGRIDDNDSGLHLSAGMNTIQGGMALAFLRSRHGVADGSDLGRITSQQQYMSSLMRTMKSASTLSNPVKLYGLAQAAAQNMRLSTSLASLDTMVSLALSLKDVNLDKMTFVQYPSAAITGSGKVSPVTATAKVLIDKIKNDEPFLLGAGALGDYSDPGPTDGTTRTPTPTPTGTPSTDPSATPTPTPDTLNGVLGQTAAEQTCAIPN